ncbi:MAG TPA: c-type cytochrome [Thermopetrobacter sp.]|nr:c-type cytochrome [Thermopetrobacter sp.]
MGVIRRHPVITLLVAGLAIAGLAIFLAWRHLSTPLPASALPAAHRPDVANGRLLYHAGGCISCHRGRGPHAALPAGGRRLKTPGGAILVPNITPDRETGIGAWRPIDFVNALKKGLGPDGTHYIPAFPYTSYAWMTLPDILDLFAYLKTLKPVKNTTPLERAPLTRFALAFWQWLALPRHAFRPIPGQSASFNRGAYLVVGPGHCGECHTPRNAIFLLDRDRWLAGAPHLSEKGKVPSLRNLKGRGRYKSVNDLASALKYGEALGYEDLSSGGMGEVQSNLARLPEADLKAIAEYLLGLK